MSMLNAAPGQPVTNGEPVTATQPSRLRRSDGEPIRVLVVDDEQTLAELISMALRYETGRCAAPATAVRPSGSAREFRPDVVVLDVMLPDIDGLEVLRRLRTDTPRIPVLS